MPSPSGRQTGIPTGQPNSTVLISSPMRLRSSDEQRIFSHSRTGSPPAAVRKKMTGTRLPGRTASLDSGGDPVLGWALLGTAPVYHVRYIWKRHYWEQFGDGNVARVPKARACNTPHTAESHHSSRISSSGKSTVSDSGLSDWDSTHGPGLEQSVEELPCRHY